MRNRAEIAKMARSVACLALVGCYIAGLIAMITFSFSTGLILWIISTLGGIGLLYWVRTMEKRAEDAKAAEANNKSGDKGESGDSCE